MSDSPFLFFSCNFRQAENNGFADNDRPVFLKWIKRIDIEVLLIVIDMRKLLIYPVAAFLSVFTFACSSEKVITADELGGEWNIIEVNDKAVIVPEFQTMPFIGFDFAEMRIYGNSGCNNMMGSILVDSLQPGSLSFGPIAGTLMACPDMETEQAVLDGLQRIKTFKVLASESTGNPLQVALCDEDGNEIVVMERKTEGSEKMDVAVLNGEWLIETINGEAIGKAEKMPYIGFDIAEKQVYGNAGCNLMTGKIDTVGMISEMGTPAVLSMTIGTTMMMCPDMAVEDAVLKALNSVRSVKVMDENNLVLCDEAGNEVLGISRDIDHKISAQEKREI